MVSDTPSSFCLLRSAPDANKGPANGVPRLGYAPAVSTSTWAVDDIQLGEPAFWELPAAEKDAAFAVLRRESPVTFHHEGECPPGCPMGPGFWWVVRHDDVRMVGRQ